MSGAACDTVVDVHDLSDEVDQGQTVESTGIAEDLISRLDATIEDLWAKARRGPFWKHVVDGQQLDPELYRILMCQLYHYTRHNSVNQAVAAFGADPDQIGLLRFVYGHADEELGHEKMVLHDLRAIGLLGRTERVAESPLPATEALINYLYGVALRQGPVARLGYSYWAESVYGYIGPVLAQARRSMGLIDAQMAFFVAHAEIDSKHADEVAATIRRWVRSEEDAEAVHQVAVTTLWLTIGLMEQAYESWAEGR